MDSYNGIIILKEPVEKKQSNPASKVAAYLLLASLFVVGAATTSIAAGGRRRYSSTPPEHSSVRGLVTHNLSQIREWSGWFSDNLDSGRNININGISTYSQLGRGDGVISGIRCRDDYCDDMQARFEIPERSAGSQVAAFWSRSISVTLSEEDGGEYVCPSDHFVSGLHCYGSNCDGLDIRCSKFSNRPRGFCYWENGWFSEEQGEITFRDGYSTTWPA
jgi:hypothetical protein